MDEVGRDPLIVLLESKSIEVEMISKGEKLKLLSKWRHVFAGSIFETTDKPVLGNRDLEVFRKSLILFVADSESEEEYLRQPDTKCVILSSDNSPALLLSNKPPFDLKCFCVEGSRPWGLGSAGGGRTYNESEILVFPCDFGWTLAMDEASSFFAFKGKSC